jgi:hypothetical protein
MIKTRLKIFATAGIILLGATIGASAGAAYSDTYIMKDVRSAPGHSRSQAAKLADARACGASRDAIVQNDKLSAALDCMSARGWAVARIEPNESARAANRSNATDDDSWRANEAAAQQTEDANASWAATQQWTSDQENAAMADVAAETEATGEAQMEAAQQAAAQAQMQQSDQQ